MNQQDISKNIWKFLFPKEYKEWIRLQQQIKETERMRIDFVANVSHELRTPLTSIKGYTDTLINDANEGQPIDKNFLNIIARNTERLIHLVSDLLDLSSIESGATLQKEEIKTEEITNRVLKQLQKNFLSKNQTIETKYDALAVYADAHRLEQVLVNLLDNAQKYTPSGGCIKILWQQAPKGISFQIEDNGPGISEKHLPRLFERFYRVDKARSREQGGTGLGLAIVKHIMQRHDGSVTVESNLGKGTLFTCTFPLGN